VGVTAPIGSPELTRLTGLTYRQVDHWTKTGVLRPYVAAKGSGYSRQFPPAEAYVAVILARYVRAFGRTDASLLARIAAAARTAGPNRWIRLDGVVVEPVTRPLPDGAAYLSVGVS